MDSCRPCIATWKSSPTTDRTGPRKANDPADLKVDEGSRALENLPNALHTRKLSLPPALDCVQPAAAFRPQPCCAARLTQDELLAPTSRQ
jgi:hypothetical protein